MKRVFRLGFCLWGWAISLVSPSLASAMDARCMDPKAGQGIMVGEVTTTSALVQLRLTRTDKLVDHDVPGMAGMVEFTLIEVRDDGARMQQIVKATAEHDFIARTPWNGLKPDTHCR